MERRFEHIARVLKEAALETLWPTRCAVCDAPGMLLCNRCHERLPFLDLWRACPDCGSAWGRLECCACNTTSLNAMGLDAFPFDGCASALVLNEESGRIATVFKDGGEQRLARVMAILMEPYAAPAWIAQRPFVTFVPATRDAYLRRGFDHAELLARELAGRLGLPGGALFERPRSLDQRALSREERVRNMAAAFHVQRMWTEAAAENRKREAAGGEAPSPRTTECERTGLIADCGEETERRTTAACGAEAGCVATAGCGMEAEHGTTAACGAVPSAGDANDTAGSAGKGAGRGAERALPFPKTLLIVDDVFTTGATLAAASMAAKRAGAETVYALTFARTP